MEKYLFGRVEGRERMNWLAAQNKPFFFIISFDRERIYLFEKRPSKSFAFSFPGFSFGTAMKESVKPSIQTISMPKYSEFQRAFNAVQAAIHRGDTYLCNLTCKIPIQLNSSLKNVYAHAFAKYKVYLPNEFVCFSPETFVQIRNGYLHTYPMKGTMDASMPQADQALLEDTKETAEHYTVVDLLRNDISRVGKRTKVVTFKEMSKIRTSNGEIYQLSSHIRTQMPQNWQAQLGDILFDLLPAGSISGAPKPKTLDIIQRVENHNRSFYTGIAGFYFDGKLDSCVLIRYISQEEDQYFYFSGAGITHQSDCKMEYNEIQTKIYIPVF